MSQNGHHLKRSEICPPVIGPADTEEMLIEATANVVIQAWLEAIRVWLEAIRVWLEAIEVIHSPPLTAAMVLSGAIAEIQGPLTATAVTAGRLSANTSPMCKF